MDVIMSPQDKCYQYWPDQGCWTYGNVRVAVEDFTVLVDYTIRKFCIQYVSTKKCFCDGELGLLEVGKKLGRGGTI